MLQTQTTRSYKIFLPTKQQYVNYIVPHPRNCENELSQTDGKNILQSLSVKRCGKVKGLRLQNDIGSCDEPQITVKSEQQYAYVLKNITTYL
jgi:hypothetical protein